MDRFVLHLGDCLETLRGMPDNSVDAVVTDPPYGLGKEPDALAMLKDWIVYGHHEVKGSGFMGKAWDAFVPQPVLWAEVYRVLKPGGHVVAFAGTRTQDLMALGMRLAGFEIRDLLAWVYGSGFPKSLDVSKAIDKRKDWAAMGRVAAAIKAARSSAGLTLRQVGDAVIESSGGRFGGWYHRGGHMFFETGRSIPTRGEWPHLKLALHLGDECDEAFEAAEREVVGSVEMRDTSQVAMAVAQTAGEYDGAARRVVNITAPATDAARAWQGWGTALKPALEPITLARKPLDGTVAANVLKWRTGAVNVDGCRVPAEVATGWGGGGAQLYEGGLSRDGGEARPVIGRWPANLLHDGSDEVLAGFPVTSSGKPSGTRNATKHGGGFSEGWGDIPVTGFGDTGSAARFFYCAKASKLDRDEGLEGFDARPAAAMAGNMVDGQRRSGSGQPIATPTRANIHPTVKPTDLMRWLCRLITPPGGVILDPFMGSGSTGKAAMREGFRFIGCELDPEYLRIAEARIVAAIEAPEPEPDAPPADNDNAIAPDLLAWGGVK